MNKKWKTFEWVLDHHHSLFVYPLGESGITISNGLLQNDNMYAVWLLRIQLSDGEERTTHSLVRAAGDSTKMMGSLTSHRRSKLISFLTSTMQLLRFHHGSLQNPVLLYHLYSAIWIHQRCWTLVYICLSRDLPGASTNSPWSSYSYLYQFSGQPLLLCIIFIARFESTKGKHHGVVCQCWQVACRRTSAFLALQLPK